jgi:long-chain acyl-CoA synthetase
MLLLQELLKWARQTPDKIAAADPTRELSYKRLAMFAAIIRKEVLKTTTQENVGLVLPGMAATVGCCYGVLWAGKRLVPLNFLLQPDELKTVCKDAGIDTIVTAKYFEKQLQPLGVKLLVLEDLGLKSKFIMGMFKPYPKMPKVDPEDVAVILYTSGTDGQQKGVCLTYRNFHENVKAATERVSATSDYVFLSILPMFHVFGLTALMFWPIHIGGTVHYIPRFQATQVVNTIKEKKVTIFMAVSGMYRAMLRVAGATPEDLSSLLYTISGGEALPDVLYDDYKARYGIEILQGYGLTETSPIVSVNIPSESKKGTTGRPLRGIEFRTVDDDGKDVGPDGVGEILIRGHCVMKGYYKRPDLTAKAVDSDGWLKTGDMGKLDADGYLSITGRKKEMIIVGGENVYPREIENVLDTHEAVAESAVVGQNDGLRGEIPVAFVTLHEGQETTDRDLRDFCRKRLAAYKVPKQIHIAVDLPRGPTGKILKRGLHGLLEKRQAS